MLNLYPANRLENLVALLDKVLALPKENILSQDIILTQSQGMKHWLNLELAKRAGISMNVDFIMPGQFFWQLIRQLLGKNEVPEHSPYSREVLSWRIYQLLDDDSFTSLPEALEPNKYWQNGEKPDDQKRFQLASQQADLFEQYLIYRPDWIENWQQGNIEEKHSWQAKLWQLLVQDEPQHLVSLLSKARQALHQKNTALPERICIFGVNTMPPLWLEFLDSLAQHTQVHLFHLNPCVEYWGDIQSEKQMAKWLAQQKIFDNSEQPEQIYFENTNPLLANLGAQGREFLSLMPDYAINEIALFEAHDLADTQPSTLHKIQQDILTLSDARGVNNSPEQSHIDDSIVISSSHSALREVQQLHDYLLHQFNLDPQLTPKDIIVMCPQVEDYAPYVEAVFSRSWDEFNEKIPPLPCSIADRSLKNAEPLVEAFEQLLQLPDSRFQVSEIISYVKLSAISEKFKVDEDEIILIEQWLEHAAIHWGLDAEHKSSILSQGNNTQDTSTYNAKYTWQQGLQRLLLGFAYSDHQALFQEKLLLPIIEGEQAQTLGKFLLIIERLNYYAKQLNKARTPKQWHEFLTELKDSLFGLQQDEQAAYLVISEAINQLIDYCHNANFIESLPLSVVKDFLTSHFSQPEPGRQFLTGQVTFCSMVPMRSVPFKLVCILGLNDGQFPRQRQPLGFDLIAQGPARKGDRSRRGDDRYLFLEALISCREKLYLSYQGKDIKDNSDKEPSTILKELMDYLSLGYGWKFSPENQLNQSALQAFSAANYQGKYPSFDPHWLKLSSIQSERDNLIKIDNETQPLAASELDINVLIHYFTNPIGYFAQHGLSLYLPQTQHSDSDNEPFASNALDKYLLRQQYLSAYLDDGSQDVFDEINQIALASDQLPDNHLMTEELSLWQQQAEQFQQSLPNTSEYQTVTGSYQGETRTVTGTFLQNSEGDCLVYRLASPKGKDYLTLYFHHLLATVNKQSQVTTRGYFYQEKNLRSPVKEVVLPPLCQDVAVKNLEKLIQIFHAGLSSPLFIPADLAVAAFTKNDRSGKHKALSQSDFAQLWHSDKNQRGYNSDDSIRFFYPQCPDFETDIKPLIEYCYLDLFTLLNPKLLAHDEVSS